MPSSRRSKEKQVVFAINPLAKCESCIFFTTIASRGYCFRRSKRVSNETPACKFYLEDKKYLEVSKPVKVNKGIRSVVGSIVVMELEEISEHTTSTTLSVITNIGSKIANPEDSG